ncbi:MAG: NTP transferase domain-containing protein, partial [Chitinivibrionales bacterium]|nr:NTP transferase domain-containing protein [Chitinivibrionales bacterium]
MTGFVLAAGFGTRLKPITDHIPKALMPLCGKPLLARVLTLLQHWGIACIAVNGHYCMEQMADFQKTSIPEFTLLQEAGYIRGTGGALYNARAFLEQDETFCVYNVDLVLSGVDFAGLRAQFDRSDSMCTLIAAPALGKGTIVYNKKTCEFAGTTKECRPAAGQKTGDFIGLAFYRKAFLNFITADDFSVIPLWRRA